jgi:hypothetical protein
MLSETELESKAAEFNGDVLYLHGHTVKGGYAWEVLLKAPELRSWEAYQAHKNDPSAQFALVQSMVVWCASDLLKCPANPRDALNVVRARFVGIAEGITSTASFLQFVGLEAHEIEK